MRQPLRPRAGVSLVVFSLMLAAVPLEAATFYVSTSGNDANSCTTAQNSSTPKRTINSARNCPSPGDTVYIRAGTYVEELQWYGGPSGSSWSNPIRFAAYAGESVTIRPSSGAERAMTLSNSGTGVDNGSRYLIFDGITFDGSNVSSDVVKITDWDGLVTAQGGFPSRHIRFTNFRFTSVMPNSHPQQGLLTGGEDIQLIVGEIDHIGASGGAGTNSQGVYGTGDDFLMDRVNIHHIYGFGVSNINSAAGQQVNNHTIKNSWVHDNTGGGINLGEGTGHLIYNNITSNNTTDGIHLSGFGAGSSTGIKVYNNTSYGNGTFGIIIDGDQNGALIRNNISYNNGVNYQNDGRGTISSNNSTTGTNPNFVNAAGANFRLTASSACCLNTGTTVTEVPTDNAGVARPQGSAYDIGAYELGVQQTSSPPAPPAHLRILN